MVSLRSLSVASRKQVEEATLEKLRRGESTRNVARELQVSQSWVAKFRKQHLSELSDVNQSFGGRPKMYSAVDRRACVRAITVGGLETAHKVGNYLREELHVGMSDSTVRRVLRKAGLKCKVKQKKPKLTLLQIKRRLEFARCHCHWTDDDWDRVVFSDETKINRFCSDGRSWCWFRDEQSRSVRMVQQTVKFGGGGVMMWGCMTSSGPGMMCRIEGRMDQYMYREILERELIHTLHAYDLDPANLIFQHDNDPKHTSKSVRRWLNLQEFVVLKWPAQSPDLNPIEHLWATLKRRLNQYERPPKGMLELWERVEDCWASITSNECQNLYRSMPKRIAAVIAAKGRWTNF